MRLATYVILLLVMSHVSHAQEIPEWAEKVQSSIYQAYVDHYDPSLPPAARHIPEFFMPDLIIDRDGRLMVDVAVTVRSDAAIPQIEQLGLIAGNMRAGNRLTLWTPLAKIPALAKIDEVLRISHDPFKLSPQTNQSHILIDPTRLDESSAYINANEAKRVFGFKGKDVVVGIIDTGWISAT